MSSRIDLVVATRNKGKAREFARLLGDTFQLCDLPPQVVLPAETGGTFAENARLKAKAVFGALGRDIAVLGDDSGLEVEGLGGRPGVLSARYAGESAGDEDNVRKLLGELEGTTNRRARFVCSLCLLLAPASCGGGSVEQMIEVEGVVEGSIADAPRGDAGFGYDPIFVPNAETYTLAEASPEAKDGLSHRGAAVRALLAHIAHTRVCDLAEPIGHFGNGS